MPMLLGTKGDDILQWRASVQLLQDLEERLAGKWGRSTAGEAEAFLHTLIDTFDEELAYESQLDRETALLDEAMGSAEHPARLKELQLRYRELLGAHFRRRGSVLALCGACNRLHDLVLERCAAWAEGRMRQLGQPSAPVYALLVSGDRGRGEQTLFGRNRYLLLHELDSPGFLLFSGELRLALQEAGLARDESALWQGSLSQWRALLSGGAPSGQGMRGNLLAPLPPFATPSRQEPPQTAESGWRLEAMADLLFLAGYQPLAAEALGIAALAVKEQRGRDSFFQLARGVIHLPLALGHFGRWRLERDPGHKGEINVEELALAPLVLAVRVLAVQAGLKWGGTLQRVRELLYKGALDVDLAERLVQALHCLLQLKIESEIRSEQSGAFANPEEFTVEQDARLRASVEAVLSLQKIAYQRLVGQV